MAPSLNPTDRRSMNFLHLVREPRVAFDVGCSCSDFAGRVKQILAQAKIWGIELSQEVGRYRSGSMRPYLNHAVLVRLIPQPQL